MPSHEIHGDQRRLKDLLDERLSQAEQETALEHVGQCRQCQEALETLAAEPSWWEDASRLLPAHEMERTPTGSSRGAEVHLDEAFLVGDFACDYLAPCEIPGTLGKLGQYEILEIIGRGGMGIVLKGFDRELNRYVAVKALAPHLAASAAARARFAREAKAAAAVVHPHVVAIHSVSGAGRLPHLVMPLVTGESLQQRLDRCGPLELKEVLRIGMQAAQGLAAAHAQGLVHRDVKPANILLESAEVDRVMLTDFGLARTADEASLTRSGIIPGTPQYMSPEQARGESADHRSDLFSLGSVLYAMGAGHPPFRAESALAVLRRICDEAPRPIREVNPDVPAWLARIIERLHAKRADERYPSAAELARVLEHCLAHVQQPTVAALPEELAEKPSAPRWGGRKGWLAGLAIVAGLTALLFCSVRWFAPPSGATTQTTPASHEPSASNPPASAAEADESGVDFEWHHPHDGELHEISRAIESLEVLNSNPEP
jgi:serine/threonine-protein kinase